MRSLILLLLCSSFLLAQELPQAKPKDVGLDAKKLAAVDAAIQAHVDNKNISGSVTLIARRGKVAYFKAHGMRDVAGEKPMKLDTIFRIYSMTKPVTSVAAMLLVEQDKLRLDEPVSTYIPELKGLKVHGSEEPAKPEMTVRDLMRHTSGLTYGFFGNTPADQAYRKAGVLSGPTLKAMVTKLSALPLASAPGAEWRYSVSTDLLGRVVEVVSKQSLDKFLKERIFDPLGMKDTGFFVPKEKFDRFSTNYRPGLQPSDVPATSRFARPTPMFSGGGGLVSTAKDYALFCLMLAKKGKGLLKPETVAEMTRNQLADALMPIRFGLFKMQGVGFGLGFSVRIDNGEFGWAGAASTTFWISPKKDLVFINMIQRMPMWAAMSNELRPLVYAAATGP